MDISPSALQRIRGFKRSNNLSWHPWRGIPCSELALNGPERTIFHINIFVFSLLN